MRWVGRSVGGSVGPFTHSQTCEKTSIHACCFARAHVTAPISLRGKKAPKSEEGAQLWQTALFHSRRMPVKRKNILLADDNDDGDHGEAVRGGATMHSVRAFHGGRDVGAAVVARAAAGHCRRMSLPVAVDLAKIDSSVGRVGRPAYCTVLDIQSCFLRATDTFVGSRALLDVFHCTVRACSLSCRLQQVVVLVLVLDIRDIMARTRKK